jgi:penicillin-insensitive murein DD-endopeptidase
VNLRNRPRGRGAALAAALAGALSSGCVGSPSPLAPALRGSIGVPHQGVVTHAVGLKKEGDGYRLFRDNGVRWGNPRLVAAIEHAAAAVARERPGGSPLIVADLSARFGGEVSGHRSHRSGRDADLLLYALTPAGVSVRAPGFVKYGADGLGVASYKEKKQALLRFDVEREWLLVRALITAPDANVQWLFLAGWLEALIIEYARARGEDPELVWHAESALLQPGDSSAHDDHIHMRIACTPDEAVAGCLGGGPYWPWLAQLPQLAPARDAELAEAIVGDLLAPKAVSHAGGTAGHLGAP